MLKKLSFLNRNLVWYIPAFMALGIIYGNFYDATPLKVLIIPATILMIYPMMVTLNTSAVFSKCSVKLQAATQIVNFVLIPLIGYVLGLIFLKGSPLLAFGLLLMAVLPTSGMTISWTGFARGNVNVAVKMTFIGLIAGSLLTPVYGKVLMGRVIAISAIDIFQRIGIVIFIPLALGFATRALLIRKYGKARFMKDIKPNFPLISTMAVLAIIFLAMALKARVIVTHPDIILSLLLPLLIFYGVNYALTTVIGRVMFSRADAVALVYGTVMRNLSVALAIAMTAFGKQGVDIALIIAAAYVFQVQSAAWYVKHANRFFGPPPEDRVMDASQQGIFSLSHTASLQDAVNLLDEEHIHSVAVLSGNNKPLGLITSEMIIDLLAGDVDLSQNLGRLDLLPIITFPRESPLIDAIKKMKKEHEYKVLVADDSGALTGVLTKSDVLDRFARN